MEAFESKTYNIRRLLKNEVDESDRGKNYFIPPYQRKYAWEEDEVKKLINDIFEQLDKKDESGYSPYFIGGIVLSKQSMIGEDRSAKSLEVIDGQQRLTTIVLILASIVQLLKFQGREFLGKGDAAQHLKTDISELLKIKSLNLNTMTVEEKYILERSDNLADDYRNILHYLIDQRIKSENDLLEIVQNNDDAKRLVKLTVTILNTIEIFDDNELIEFTIQLLNNTWLVVTKTVSIETGFFIFEKLNDSGIALEPQDLLKNYIFRTSNKNEYELLTEKWEEFLKHVKDINTTKAKILPRDFLEQYLTIIGNSLISKDGKKEKIFDKYKQLHEESFDISMELLNDLILVAKEYQIIKRNNFSKYINTINFKLGFLIVLSFYKRFPDEYNNYQKEILSIVIRLGLTYSIIGQSKSLSTLIPQVCREIIEKNETIEVTINYISGLIRGLLVKKKDIFDEVLSSTNVYRKKPLTKLILNIIEYNLSAQKSDNSKVLQLMPKTFYEECNYIEIDEDNCTKYANFIGNLLLNNNIYEDQNTKCLEDRYIAYKNSDNLIINDINKKIKIENNALVHEDNSEISIWGKPQIMERSQMIAEAAKFLLIEDNFKKDFFD